MSNTIVVTEASGSTDTFSVPFPRILPEHIEVRLDGVLLALGVDYTFPDSSNIELTAGNPSAGSKVLRRRVTPTTAIVTYNAGALDEDDLTMGDRQSRYLAEEALDHSEYVKTILAGIDVETVVELAAQVAADADQVDTDKGIVAADKDTVAGDKAIVLGYRDEVEADRVTVQADKVIASAAADAAVVAQAAAEAAKDQALAAFANFEDVYLGAYPTVSAPTLDLDGSALEPGDLYYDETLLVMMVWTGSVWGAAYVDGSTVLLKSQNLNDLPNKATARTNLDVYSRSEIDLMPGSVASKTTPVDADSWSIWDSVASAAKRVTGTNLKAYLKAYFDTLYQAAGSYVTTARNVSTQHSLTGGGNLSADRTLSLVNDSASPGNNMVYGTNGSGVRGWKADPVVADTRTWQSPSRALATSYQNTSGGIIQVAVDVTSTTGGGNNATFQTSTDGSSWTTRAAVSGSGRLIFTMDIPNNLYYRVSHAGATLNTWSELRP